MGSFFGKTLVWFQEFFYNHAFGCIFLRPLTAQKYLFIKCFGRIIIGKAQSEVPYYPPFLFIFLSQLFFYLHAFFVFVCLFVFMLWQDSNGQRHYSSASPVRTAPVSLQSFIPVVVLSTYANIHHPHFCSLSESHTRVVTMCQSCFSVPVSTESLLDQCDNTPRHLTKRNFTLIECYQWLMRCLSLVLTPPVYPSFIPHFFYSSNRHLSLWIWAQLEHM